MDEWINYDQFDRQTWHSFFPSEITFLTQENLDEIKSLNDQISLRDVQDIYLPLIKQKPVNFCIFSTQLPLYCL